MTLVARNLADAPRGVARPLTLGLLTPHNIHDPRDFSGTVYHAARALLRTEGDRLARRLGRGPAPITPPTSADLRGPDAVVGLVASDLLDRLPPGVPYIHVTDATPGFLAEAYGWDIAPETHAREARAAGLPARLTLVGRIPDPAGWEMMSDAAFDRARAVFSWDVCAARVAEVVHCALAGARRAA